MQTFERTDNIYEVLEHYPNPQLIPKSAFDEKRAIENLNPNFFHKFLFKTFFTLSGYNNFKKKVENIIEPILRKGDNQSGAMLAPVVSATIGIKDDENSLDISSKAASLVIGARLFLKDILSGKLPPDKLKDDFLEMGQYPNLFSTTQLIENGKIRLYKSSLTDKILVIARNRYFILNIGELESEINTSQLKNTFSKIIELVESENTLELSPGVITCGSNRSQIKIFNELEKSEINKNSLNEIKDVFLVVALDIDNETANEAETTKLAHIGNLNNRWYHASLQIVLSKNSKTALVCNFSNNISGNVMMRSASEINLRAKKIASEIKENVTNENLSFHELKWELKKEQIEEVKKELNPFFDSQDSTFYLKNINKKYLEEKNAPPVPTFILALQLTLKKLIQKNVNLTQFVSLSKFRCMDLTTAIVTTNECNNFVESMLAGDKNKTEFRLLFNSAVKSQQEIVRESRKTLSVIDQIDFFIESKKGIQKKITRIFNTLLMIILGVTGFFKNKAREVILSHPAIYDDVLIVGRPGVKIPYAKYFGLHYQIMDEQTVITVMPGIKWQISNEDLIAELENSMEEILKNI